MPLLGTKVRDHMPTNITKTRTPQTTALPANAKPNEPLAELVADGNRATEYARAEKAGATRRAYATDFAIFSAWCADRGRAPLPASPALVAAFLAFEANRGTRPSTISRRIAAIRYAHKLSG